jgi:hypothetical protein
MSKDSVNYSLPKAATQGITLTSDSKSYQDYKYAQDDNSGAAEQASDIHMSKDSAKYLFTKTRHSGR